MANFICSVCILVIYLFVNSNGATTSKYVSYNSSDLSYLSNGIQIPVPILGEQDRIIQEFVNEDLPEMEWLSRLYDHHTWERRLSVIESANCKTHLSAYLSNLKNGTSWAVKS